MAKKGKEKGGISLDGRPLDMPFPGVTPTDLELLDRGNIDEVRSALGSAGAMIRSNIRLNSDVAEWLGSALERIGKGARPDTVFRIHKNGFRRSLSWERVKDYMIETAVAPGWSREEIVDAVERYSPKDNVLHGAGSKGEGDRSHGERKKKRDQREKAKGKVKK